MLTIKNYNLYNDAGNIGVADVDTLKKYAGGKMRPSNENFRIIHLLPGTYKVRLSISGLDEGLQNKITKEIRVRAGGLYVGDLGYAFSNNDGLWSKFLDLTNYMEDDIEDMAVLSTGGDGTWDVKVAVDKVVNEEKDPELTDEDKKKYFLSESKMKKLAGMNEDKSGSRLFKQSELDSYPKIYSQDGKKKENVKIIAKLMLPGTRWTWYLTEYDGERDFFGYVKSGFGADNDELGYVSLEELESLKVGPFRVERDKHLSNDLTLAKVMATKEIV